MKFGKKNINDDENNNSRFNDDCNNSEASISGKNDIKDNSDFKQDLVLIIENKFSELDTKFKNLLSLDAIINDMYNNLDNKIRETLHQISAKIENWHEE